jgi:uncharacterized protein YneF (UPF0154 family)
MEMIDKDVLINIIIGIILGYFLYRFLIYRRIYKGPDSRDIINQIYEWNGKKVKLVPKVCACPISW